MPDIPTFEADTEIRPVGQPEAAAGPMGAIGAGLARAGSELYGPLREFDLKHAEAQRSAETSSNLATGTEQLGDAAFRHGKTPDAKKAVADYHAESGQIIQNILKDVRDPIEQATLQNSLNEQAAQRELDVRRESFGLESSAQAGELDRIQTTLAQQILAARNNPVLRDQLLHQGLDAIDVRLKGGWITGKEAADRKIQFGGQVDYAQGRDLINQARIARSAQMARDAETMVNDPHQLKNLSDEQRESLIRQASVVTNSLEDRDIRLQEHREREADRNLQKVQGARAFHDEMLILEGKLHLTPEEVDDRVRAGIYDEAGGHGIISAGNQWNRGRDDRLLAPTYWQRVLQGTATNQDVDMWGSENHISQATQLAMHRTIQAMGPTGDKATRAAALTLQKNLDVLIAKERAMGGMTTEASDLAARDMAEFGEKVYLEHKDPTKTITEILARDRRGIEPTWLPPLKNGARPHTQQDLLAAGGWIHNQHEIGLMNDDEFKQQGELYGLYKMMLPPGGAGAPARSGAVSRPSPQPSTQPTPAPTPTPSPQPSVQPQPTPQPTPTAPPTQKPTPQPTPSPSTTPAPKPPPTPSPTPTPAPAPAPPPRPQPTPAPSPRGAAAVPAHATAPPPPPRTSGPPPPPPQLGPPQVPSSAVAHLPPLLGGKRPRSQRDIQAFETGLHILKNSGAIDDKSFDRELANAQRYADIIYPSKKPTEDIQPKSLDELPAMWNGQKPRTEYDIRQAEQHLEGARSAYGDEVYRQQKDLLAQYKAAVPAKKDEEPRPPPPADLPPLFGKKLKTKKDLEDARTELLREMKEHGDADEILQHHELLIQYQAQIGE